MRLASVSVTVVGLNVPVLEECGVTTQDGDPELVFGSISTVKLLDAELTAPWAGPEMMDTDVATKAHSLIAGLAGHTDPVLD